MASVIRWMAGSWLTAAILVMGFSAPAFAKFESGPWTGSAYASNSGKFERCVMTSEHPNGMRLGFGRSVDGAFEIWLLNKAWELQPNTAQHVTLWVDGGAKRTGDFQVVSRDAMAAQFGADGAALAEALKRGNVLHVTTATQAIDFKLTGTFKAIGELDQCWSQSASGAPAAAKPTKPAAGAAKPAGPAKRAKGMDLLALSPRDFAGQVVTSGKPGFFTVPENLPEAMRKWNAALLWNVTDGMGLATGVGSNPDAEALRDNLVQQKKPKCKGEMTSSADARALPGTAIQVKRVEIRCSDIGDGKGVTEVFAFYPHLSGQLLVISHVANDRKVAAAADEEFAKRVIAILTAK